MRAALLVPFAVILLAACGTTPTGPDGPSAGASSSAAASIATPPSPASSSSGPASAGATAVAAGSCELLTLEDIEAVLGVRMPDGVSTFDEARQVDLCTWTNPDPVTIVATGLTTVGADDAYELNKTLAPAYFDGEPVDVTVPGTEKAYVVESPGVGWVVGAIASGQYVQVQIGGTDLTQAQAVTLMQAATARLA